MESSIWRENGGQSYSHFVYAIIIFTFAFVAARFFLDTFFFRRLATWMCGGSVSSKAKKSKMGNVIKCSESMWKLTYYAIVEVCVLTITYNEPWFKEGEGYYVGWPNQELKVSLELFYMCQCGFYIYSIIALLTWETRRKDFAVMMSHHVITVISIGISYATRFFRIGSVILALHDATDVFIEAANIFKCSGNEIGASVLFGCFAIAWLILRLIFFPFWVIKATSVDLCDYLRCSEAFDATLYYIFNTMLLTLLVFHIYWFKLICALILRQLKNQGKVREDIREDSENDDEVHTQTWEDPCSGTHMLSKIQFFSRYWRYTVMLLPDKHYYSIVKIV